LLLLRCGSRVLETAGPGDLPEVALPSGGRRGWWVHDGARCAVICCL